MALSSDFEISGDSGLYLEVDFNAAKIDIRPGLRHAAGSSAAGEGGVAKRSGGR
jgi:hypothetical protein